MCLTQVNLITKKENCVFWGETKSVNCEVQRKCVAAFFDRSNLLTNHAAASDDALSLFGRVQVSLILNH